MTEVPRPAEFEDRLNFYLLAFSWDIDRTGGKYRHHELAKGKGVDLPNAVFLQLREDVRDTNNAERLARSLRGARVVG